MNRKAFFVLAGQILLASVLSVSAYTAMAVEDFDEDKVAVCVACHGADGKGKAAQYPDLQGKPVEYIVAQLQYFKSGLRENPAMNVIAGPLSQEDIQMLAEFFNQVE